MEEDDKFKVTLHGEVFDTNSIVVTYGKYQMKNWEYLAELACAYPELIVELIIDATRTELINERDFKEGLQINSEKLTKPKTRPGVYYMLSVLIQHPEKIKDVSPEALDKIIEKLDDLLGEFKKKWAYGHIYHLRNWEMLIDLTSLNPDLILEIVGFSALLKTDELGPTEENLTILKELDETLAPGLNTIICAKTIEGLESILLMLLKNSFETDIDSTHFDDVLKLIDYRMDNALRMRTILLLSDTKHEFKK